MKKSLATFAALTVMASTIALASPAAAEDPNEVNDVFAHADISALDAMTQYGRLRTPYEETLEGGFLARGIDRKNGKVIRTEEILMSPDDQYFRIEMGKDTGKNKVVTGHSGAFCSRITQNEYNTIAQDKKASWTCANGISDTVTSKVLMLSPEGALALVSETYPDARWTFGGEGNTLQLTAKDQGRVVFDVTYDVWPTNDGYQVTSVGGEFPVNKVVYAEGKKFTPVAKLKKTTFGKKPSWL